MKSINLLFCSSFNIPYFSQFRFTIYIYSIASLCYKVERIKT